MQNAAPCFVCSEAGHKASRCSCLHDVLRDGFFAGGSGGGSHDHDDEEEEKLNIFIRGCAFMNNVRAIEHRKAYEKLKAWVGA